MNKPIAWIIDASMTDCDDNFIWNTGDYPDWQIKDWIPLYTHPAELTDEEMLECAEGAGCVFDYSYKGEVTFISKNAFKRFVQAILRKAKER